MASKVFAGKINFTVLGKIVNTFSSNALHDMVACRLEASKYSAYYVCGSNKVCFQNHNYAEELTVLLQHAYISWLLSM